MDAGRGLRSQVGDHLVAQLDAEGRARLWAQQWRAHEELPDRHGQAVRQSGDVCAGRPCGQLGRHHRRRWQGQVDPLSHHIGSGGVVAEPFALVAHQPADQGGHPEQ